MYATSRQKRETPLFISADVVQKAVGPESLERTMSGIVDELVVRGEIRGKQ